MSVLTQLNTESRASKEGSSNPANPSYWVNKLFGGGTETTTGIQIDEKKALQYSAVWAAVNIISGAIGFLPLVVYRRLEPRGKERAYNHYVYYLLHDRPNPYMDSYTFMETLQGHVLTWGNGYAEIERDNVGHAKYLWPLLPNQVEPVVSDDGNSIYYKVRQKNKTVIINYMNMLHIKGLGFDGVKGYSVIDYAAESLGLGLAAQKFGARFFGKGATASGVVEHPGRLSETASKNLRSSIEEQIGGLDKSSRLLILEEGMKWHQVGIPPENAQFLETRKFEVADVARWFNVPVHMLNELERSTFNNVEHTGIEFVTWTLAKWLKRWELETTYKLIPEPSQTIFFTEFIVNALLRGDTKSRFEAYKTAFLSGFYSINDIREKENENPVANGDKYYVPLNMAPIGSPPPDKNMAATNDDATRSLLKDTWSIIINKEVAALNAIVKRNENVANAIEEFYQKHQTYTQRMLEPVYKFLYNGSEYVGRAYNAVQRYIKDSCSMLDNIIKSYNSNINKAVESLGIIWQEARADDLANQDMERKRNMTNYGLKNNQE